MKFAHLALAAALTLAWPAAHAGRSCDPQPQTVTTMRQAFELSARTRAALDTSDARIALVARAGRDLSQYGLRFSHFGVAWRDHPDGRWTVIHKLNHCESDRADLYAEGLANFFADDMFAYEAWLLVPTDAVQSRLEAALVRDSGASFHRPAYSLVSYPFSTKYQNSNAWALELVASAMSGDDTVRDGASAQAWLKANGYQPTRFPIGPLKRLGGRMFRANIAFDDHPPALRWTNRIDTVSVESVYAFARQRDVVQTLMLVTLTEPTP